MEGLYVLVAILTIVTFGSKYIINYMEAHKDEHKKRTPSDSCLSKC
jgi:hypothetical protein